MKKNYKKINFGFFFINQLVVILFYSNEQIERIAFSSLPYWFYVREKLNFNNKLIFVFDI